MRTRLRIGRRLGRATIGESADKQIKEARAALVSENSASQWHRTKCTVTRTRQRHRKPSMKDPKRRSENVRLSLLDESRHVACASKQPITSRTIGTHGTLLGGTAARQELL